MRFLTVAIALFAFNVSTSASDYDAEAALALAAAQNQPKPLPINVPIKPTTSGWSLISPISPVGHTHTDRNGHTWDHRTNPEHTCPLCGDSQFIQDTFPKMVNIGRTSSVQTTQSQSFEQFQSYTSSGCVNGNCPTGQFQQPQKARGKVFPNAPWNR